MDRRTFLQSMLATLGATLADPRDPGGTPTYVSQFDGESLTRSRRIVDLVMHDAAFMFFAVTLKPEEDLRIRLRADAPRYVDGMRAFIEPQDVMVQKILQHSGLDAMCPGAEIDLNYFAPDDEIRVCPFDFGIASPQAGPEIDLHRLDPSLRTHPRDPAREHPYDPTRIVLAFTSSPCLVQMHAPGECPTLQGSLHGTILVGPKSVG